MLELKQLTKSFGEKEVLGHFSHTFPARGTMALLGPSGCGKTTLFRLIAGLDKPDSGSILFEGSTVSMVFQEDRLLESLTAGENILAVFSKPGQKEAALVEELLRQAGLEGEGSRYPQQLSGGMKRRVAVARALAFGGDLLLLDEPFKGLDLDTKNQLLRLTLSGPAARERLNLLVTHDPVEAALCADEVLILDGPPLTAASLKLPPLPSSGLRSQEEAALCQKAIASRLGHTLSE